MQVWRSPQGQPVLVQAGSSLRDATLRRALPRSYSPYRQDLKTRSLTTPISRTRAAARAGSSASRHSAGSVIGDRQHGSRSLCPPQRARRTRDRPLQYRSVRCTAGCRSGGPRPRQAVPGTSLGEIGRRAVQATVCWRIIRTQAARYRLLQDRSVTVRQIIARGGGGHYRFVGTPEQIVDFMEKWVDEGAADGFNLFMDVYPRVLRSSWIR